MNKEFIPYEQALEIEKLGYNENDCILFWYCHVDGHALLLDHPINDHTYMPEKWYKIPAPLYQQAFRWFRDKHNIKISIDYKSTDEICYFYKISFQRLANGEIPPVMVWHHCDSWLGLNIPLSTYQEAELACLKKLIEIIKNK